MKKRTILVIALVLAFALSLSAVSNATQIQPYANPFRPTLDFDGTTAKCFIRVYKPEAEISVTLTLRYGGTHCATWYGKGTSSVIVDQIKEVATGHTYTLTAYITVDGVALDPSSVTGTCN